VVTLLKPFFFNMIYFITSFCVNTKLNLIVYTLLLVNAAFACEIAKLEDWV